MTTKSDAPVRVYLLLTGDEKEVGRVRARNANEARAEGARHLNGRVAEQWRAANRRVCVQRQRVTGRPRQRADLESRSRQLAFKVSPSELAAIKAAAEDAGETLSAFVRSRLMAVVQRER